MKGPLPLPQTMVLTAVAMLAFVVNPVLCRLALSETAIDPATFTLARFGSSAGAETR
jgi:hypothetical protein